MLKILRNQRKENILIEIFGAILIYTSFTLIFTHPLILHFSTHFWGDGGDGLQNVWNMWWIRKCLDNKMNPYFTDYLHQPYGTTLIFQTLNPFNAIISLPLQYFSNLIVSYNFIIFFSFITSGLTMFLLVRYLTKAFWPAVLAGIIFSFSPYHYAHSMGHLQLMAMEWVPAYILFFIKIFRERRILNTVLASFFAVLTALSDWYYFFYIFIFSVLYLTFSLFKLFWQKQKDKYKYLINVGKRLIFLFIPILIMVGPLVYKMILLNPENFIGQHPSLIFSADLLSFFVPGQFHFLFSKYFEPVYTSFSNFYSEGGNYLGYTVLLFTFFALFTVPVLKKTIFWFLSASLFFILALGPKLQIAGKILSISLPYQIIESVPLISFSGTPSRFVAMVFLSLGVIFGFSYQKIFNILDRKGRLKTQVILPLLILLLLVFEYLPGKRFLTKIDIPKIYVRIKNDPEKFIIFDVPSSTNPFTQALYFQTYHEKKMIGGYISRPSRTSTDFLTKTPFINEIYNHQASEIPKSKNEALSTFSKYKIKYIITHSETSASLLESFIDLAPIEVDKSGNQLYQLF